MYVSIFIFFQAGLEIGEMILAVNKDSLVGANYDTVSCLNLFKAGIVLLPSCVCHII